MCLEEARIGTQEVPHPIDRRLHTCIPVGGVVVEINDEAQRLFATMLMKLTEMSIEVGRIGGNEGLAAFHGAMGYLSTSDLGPEISKRAAELRAWAETTGLVAM